MRKTERNDFVLYADADGKIAPGQVLTRHPLAPQKLLVAKDLGVLCYVDEADVVEIVGQV